MFEMYVSDEYIKIYSAHSMHKTALRGAPQRSTTTEARTANRNRTSTSGSKQQQQQQRRQQQKKRTSFNGACPKPSIISLFCDIFSQKCFIIFYYITTKILHFLCFFRCSLAFFSRQVLAHTHTHPLSLCISLSSFPHIWSRHFSSFFFFFSSARQFS